MESSAEKRPGGTEGNSQNEMAMPQLQFLGNPGTVTGSKYLLTTGSQKILIDCGLFQGDKELQKRNWNPFPISPQEIDAVLITHAHIDHTGYLPKLTQLGYQGKIYATGSTVELLRILLLDSAHLQEEEAVYHNKDNGCCPQALPLYTVADAMKTLKQLTPVSPGETLQLADVSVEFIRAAHILGSAFIRVTVKENGSETVILFSGDLGRYHSPILGDPQAVPAADYLLLESTYGNREHAHASGKEELLPAIQECLRRKGCLLIPAFAVGRTQDILFTLRELLNDQAIPPLPVYLDSPMAIDVSHIYESHHDEHDLDMEGMEKKGESPFRFPGLTYARTVAESKSLNHADGPMIIISANGMCTGGRIMHHLVHRLGDEKTILLFVGYQADGTRGRQLLDGAKNVKIFHQEIPVKAAIMQAGAFSAHADYNEIAQWLTGFLKPPRTVFLVHGEPDGREGLKQHILEKFPDWHVELPSETQIQELPPAIRSR